MKSLLETTSFAELRDITDHTKSAEGSSVSVREGSAEFHYFVARGELRQTGNLAHGLSHLAELLSHDPSHPEWLALVDEYERASQGIEKLLDEITEGKQPYFATEALRAHLWGRSGRIAEAVSLLVDIAQVKPGVRYLDAWALGWLVRGFDGLDMTVAIRLLGALLNSNPEYDELPARYERTLRQWAELAIGFVRSGRIDPSLSAQANMFAAGLCRKAGLFDRALELATSDPHPSWWSAVARGLVLRKMGDADAACQAFEEAVRLDSEDLSALLEAGDTFFDAGRWVQARGFYERVLAREPEHAWASPSAMFCSWRETTQRTGEALRLPEELYRLAQNKNRRAAFLAYDQFRRYVGVVPEPEDATTASMRKMVEQVPPASAPAGSTFKLTLSDVEAPSNQLLLSLAYQGRMTVQTSYTHIASPDPRSPHSRVRYTVWKLDGNTLVPGLPPPAEPIAARIADLCAAPFRRDRTWAAAGRVAAGLASGDEQALLACLVHPPQPPPAVSVFAWVPHVQIATTFVLANLAVEEPWEQSLRREVLLSLLHGPMDWTTTAAIVALARLTRDEPAILLEVHRELARLMASRPDSGAVCWEMPLVDTWLDLDGLFPNERESLIERWKQLTEN